MSRPRLARSVASRIGVRPDRKAERARRDEAELEVDFVRVLSFGAREGERRVRRRDRRVVALVERVKIRIRGWIVEGLEFEVSDLGLRMALLVLVDEVDELELEVDLDEESESES
jgi:hypothetical protein